MKILIVTGSFAPETGGIAALVRGLAGGLLRCGAGVRILAATPGSRRFTTDSLPVEEFALPPRGYLKRVAACRRAIAKAAGTFGCDRVVASSWSPFAVHPPGSARGRPLAVDVLCHGMDLLEPARSARYRPLLRRTLARASRVIANSRFTGETALALGAREESLLVLPPGVDPERFTPGPRDPELLRRFGIAPDAPVVLSVGRLVERKGFDLVVRALPELVVEHPALAHLIVGDGPDRGRLEGLARAVGVAAHVRFAGAVPDDELAGYYRSADVFAMPARQIDAAGEVEGFGIVFLEAACCELPSIAGRSGGMPDAVEEGATGYLVDPDSPAECSARIAGLLSDPSLGRRLGACGRSRARARFTWQGIAARYLAAVGAAGERR